MHLTLTAPFAANSPANPEDTRAVKRALNRLGYYTPLRETGLTGIPDRAVFNALKKFQKDHDLRPDGEAKPGSDATIERLNAAMDEQVEKGSSYIWHTVGDDKVRDEHAAREGQVFSYESPPEDGNPGEAYNCRCWAEEVKNLKKENDCQAETAALQAAAARLQQMEKIYTSVQKEIKSKEVELANKQELLPKKEDELFWKEAELKALELIIAKDNDGRVDRGELEGKIIGILGGAAIGGVVGGGNPIGAIIGAIEGYKPGSKIGKNSEGLKNFLTVSDLEKEAKERKDEIERLKKEIAELKNTVTQLKESLEQLNKIIKAIEFEMQKAESAINTARNALEDCRKS